MKQHYRILTMILVFVLAGATTFAQQRTLSGTVKDPQGIAMPGVNVIVKGTTNGTTTDTEGKYTLTMGADASIIVFSFIGYATQEVEIGTRTSVDVSMTEDTQELSEVVVTALGIARETKALQYSVTQVKGEDLTQARENNLGNSLSGRIAGVNVSKIASGPAGSSRIVIRGNKTLGGQNQPLYVVDGIPMDNGGFNNSTNNYGQAGVWGGRDEGDGLASINPDDIESITVLKGANAAALYGSRGGNGVINIVTKKGKARKGLGIEFNSNYVFETVNNTSDLQQEYGSGQYVGGVATAPTTVQQAFDWGELAWGPKLDGRQVMSIDGIQRPYSYAGDNWKRFYDVGNSWTNSLAFTGGGEKQTFRFSVSDLRSTSIIPNAGFDRTNLSFSTNAKFGKKITFDGKVMYSHENTQNRPFVSDSPGNAIQAIWRRPPNINVNDLRGDPNKLGAIPAGVDPAILLIYGQGGSARFQGQELLPARNNWGPNPWWAAYQHSNDDRRDRVIASGQLRYDITEFLYGQGRIGMDWYTRRNTQLYPEGSGDRLAGSITEGEDRVREINMEWLLGFNKGFGKINVNAFVGGNKMIRDNERIQANGNGFNVPFFPAINNSTQRNYTYGYGKSGINSLFGSAELGYNGILFLTATARNDWFSVLNPDRNSILYPSVGASFVLSDAIETLPAWLSFAKLRASWAQVGVANIGPYDTNFAYAGLNPHLGAAMATFASALNNNGNIPNPDLKPALSSEIEFGFDTRLFDNRVGLDVTYYSQKTTDDILRATISRASGFGSKDVNVGELQNRGIEILVTGTPVKGLITWDVSVNFAKNNNKVLSLIPGSTELVFEESRTRTTFIKHIIDQPFGMITGQVQKRVPDDHPNEELRGQLIFEDNGLPVRSDKYEILGNGIADWTGGINNSFSWKGFNLSFLIDIKVGGEIHSGTNIRLAEWGLSKESVQGREGEAPLTVKGVRQTGENIFEPFEKTLTPDEARNYWNNFGQRAGENYTYDAGFGKLRQLTIGYSLPRSILNKTPFQKATLSFVGRNLAILWKNVPNIDPESSYSANAGAQGLEYFGHPATRSYGFNLNLGF